MKLTYIGSSYGDPDEISLYGETFTKGKAVEISDKHPYANKLKNNPTFSAEASEVKDAGERDEAAEKAELRKKLSEAGVEYDGRASLKTLQEKHDDYLLEQAKLADGIPAAVDPSSR